MQTEIHDADTTVRPSYGGAEIGRQPTDLFPFLALAPIAREILANADRLPDAELMRVAGSLRTLADEVMAVVDRRLGRRPKPHLVVDNTKAF
jgi:hypothetical protein